MLITQGGCVVVMRWRSSKTLDYPLPRTLVVETEIDMYRPAPRLSPVKQRFSDLMRWLMPVGASTRPPMRSVGRELEEVFPSRDN